MDYHVYEQSRICGFSRGSSRPENEWLRIGFAYVGMAVTTRHGPNVTRKEADVCVALMLEHHRSRPDNELSRTEQSIGAGWHQEYRTGSPDDRLGMDRGKKNAFRRIAQTGLGCSAIKVLLIDDWDCCTAEQIPVL
jgi:hypothetical protein